MEVVLFFAGPAGITHLSRWFFSSRAHPARPTLGISPASQAEVVYSLAGPGTSSTASASGNSDGSPTLRQCWHSGRGALVSGR